MPENKVSIILEAANKTQEAFQSVKSSSESLVSTLKQHWVAISAAAIGSIYAIKKAFDFGKEIASNLNDIQRQAEMIGITTTEYQKLSYAAKMSDVSNESLRIGMRGLSMSMAQFVDEAGDGFETLKALGLSAVDAAGKQKPLNQMFMEIADAFSSYADGATKIDYANRLMGRSGMELITMLNKGKEGITAYGEELVKMGGVIGDVVIQKGSEAEDAFKRLEVKSNTLKISIGLLALEFADFGEKIIKALDGISLFSKEADEMELKNLKAWLEYGKQQGASLEYIEDYERRILELETKREKVKAPEWIKEWVKGFTGKPEMPKPITPPEPDWIKNWIKDWDALTYSFEKLGIESQASLAKAAQAAVTYKDQIKIAFDQGKASVLDYANAVKSLTEIYKKLGGEDTFKKLNENEEDYLENVKRLNEQYPDRGQEYQKALNKIIDKWLKTKTEIEEKDPVFIRANLSKWEADLKEAANLYKTNFLSQIQPVNLSGGGGGSAGGGGYSTPPKGDYGGSWDANLKNKLATIPANVNFTATGMSPKMSLGDALSKLVDKFGGIDELISGLEAEISFDKVTVSLKKAEEELAKYTKAYNDFYAVMSRQWTKPEVRMFEGKAYTRDEFYSLMQDALSQVDILQKEQMLSLLQGSGSFQTGGRVGATGFYLLHKDEEVRTKNQVSMDGMTFNVTIPGAGDINDIADKFIKIVKYRLKGELKDLIS